MLVPKIYPTWAVAYENNSVFCSKYTEFRKFSIGKKIIQTPQAPTILNNHNHKKIYTDIAFNYCRHWWALLTLPDRDSIVVDLHYNSVNECRLKNLGGDVIIYLMWSKQKPQT
jgi:hypothetical protein